jgi:hypothetical protein
MRSDGGDKASGAITMFKCGIAGLVSVLAILAFVAFPHSAGATVIIKTFRFSICVTGEKHPDGCKKAHADAHLVVPDNQMEDLDGEVGQGATIMAPSTSGVAAPSEPGRRGRRHQNEAAPQPDM